jgi:PilZ domain
LPNQIDTIHSLKVDSLKIPVEPPVDAPSDRRREARYPAQEPAEIELLFGPRETIYGTILDVSRSGLRIELARRVHRGEEVKIKLQQNVIFGEVRYCRAVLSVFQAGIRIEELVRPAADPRQHLADDTLSLYAIGKGLSVSEVIEVREHLSRCQICRALLADKEAVLKPGSKLRGA